MNGKMQKAYQRKYARTRTTFQAMVICVSAGQNETDSILARKKWKWGGGGGRGRPGRRGDAATHSGRRVLDGGSEEARRASVLSKGNFVGKAGRDRDAARTIHREQNTQGTAVPPPPPPPHRLRPRALPCGRHSQTPEHLKVLPGCGPLRGGEHLGRGRASARPQRVAGRRTAPVTTLVDGDRPHSLVADRLEEHWHTWRGEASNTPWDELRSRLHGRSTPHCDYNHSSELTPALSRSPSWAF